MAEDDSLPNDRLLRALAEQLKLPLLQIARNAELHATSASEDVFSHIQYSADMALRLIDGYLLANQNQASNGLELEPVSVSVALQESAHRLSKIADQYGCKLELHIKGKCQPVMAHRASLEAAYTLLGYCFIEAHEDENTPVLLAAHRSSRGIVSGVFADHEGLSADMFRRARALYGSARQSFTSLSPGSSAGIFIADSLLQTMAAPLHLARHQNTQGLASTLLTSSQLQLVES